MITDIQKWSAPAKKAIYSMTSEEKERFDAVISMHFMVCNMNDENAYMIWIYLMPDEADEFDFIDFALDEEMFGDAVELFKKLWKNYADKSNGLFIGNKTY